MYSNLKLFCICQEVDKFQDLEEEMKHRGYSAIWKVGLLKTFSCLEFVFSTDSLGVKIKWYAS